MTSGRHNAIASAIACDPSICLSIANSSSRACGMLLRQHEFVGVRGRSDVGCAHLPGKCLFDCALDTVDMNELRERGKGAKQGGIRYRTADVLQRKFCCRHDHRMALGQPIGGLANMQLRKALVSVDEQIAVAAQARKDVDHLE